MLTFRRLIALGAFLALSACQSTNDVSQPEPKEPEYRPLTGGDCEPAPCESSNNGTFSCTASWSGWMGPSSYVPDSQCDIQYYDLVEGKYHFEPTTTCLDPEPTVHLARSGQSGPFGRTWINFDFDTCPLPDDAIITSAQVVLVLEGGTKWTTGAQAPSQCVDGGSTYSTKPGVQAKIGEVDEAGYVGPSNPPDNPYDYLILECSGGIFDSPEIGESYSSWQGNTLTTNVFPGLHLDRISKDKVTRVCYDAVTNPPNGDHAVWEFYSHLDQNNPPEIHITYDMPEVVVSSMTASSGSGSDIVFNFQSDAPSLRAEILYKLPGGSWTTLVNCYEAPTLNHSFTVPCIGGWVEWRAKTYESGYVPWPPKKFQANCMF